MNETKIMTLHPSSKQGVNILLRRYEVIKDFILSKLKEHSEISFDELTINDLEFTKLRKVRHLSGQYVEILPDVIGFYQIFGYPLLKEKGYTQQLDDGILKKIVDKKFGQN